MHPSPTRPGAPTRNWPALVAYFRQCLEREQMERLQVALERRGYALLRMAEDRLITREASEALITDPSDLQQVRQLIARKGPEENQLLYYAFPLVQQQRSLIPICYTPVRVEGGPGVAVRLIREGDLLLNRRFLTESGELTDAEAAQFARRLGTGC
ncbi:MAG: hypothetical protein ACOY93_04040 [Bacillota bacterium]